MPPNGQTATKECMENIENVCSKVIENRCNCKGDILAKEAFLNICIWDICTIYENDASLSNLNENDSKFDELFAVQFLSLSLSLALSSLTPSYKKTGGPCTRIDLP